MTILQLFSNILILKKYKDKKETKQTEQIN